MHSIRIYLLFNFEIEMMTNVKRLNKTCSYFLMTFSNNKHTAASNLDFGFRFNYCFGVKYSKSEKHCLFTKIWIMCFADIFIMKHFAVLKYVKYASLYAFLAI